MRLYLQVPAIAIIGFIIASFLPWYGVAFVAFFFGYLLDAESNFLGGFLGVAILWALKIFLAAHNAPVDLATTVAGIMGVPGKWVVIAVTVLLGGLTGGFACATGGALKQLLRRQEEF